VFFKRLEDADFGKLHVDKRVMDVADLKAAIIAADASLHDVRPNDVVLVLERNGQKLDATAHLATAGVMDGDKIIVEVHGPQAMPAAANLEAAGTSVAPVYARRVPCVPAMGMRSLASP
jgi:hypothetical protein